VSGEDTKNNCPTPGVGLQRGIGYSRSRPFSAHVLQYGGSAMYLLIKSTPVMVVSSD
jgi:hypothetical protein